MNSLHCRWLGQEILLDALYTTETLNNNKKEKGKHVNISLN